MNADIQAVLDGNARFAVIHGDCLDVLPTIPDKAVGVVLTDPPYSEHVHGKSRRGASLPDGTGGKWRGEKSDGACLSRARDLGFASLSATERNAVARHFARVSRRWVIAFSDLEMAHGWRASWLRAGLQHIREGLWIKIGCTPQFTGDRPAAGAEAVNIAHPKGRKRWNGGGSHAVWNHPIVLDRANAGSERVHTTQKPVSLMLELVGLFTDPDEVVIDPYFGSGSTGVAALRLGRRVIGIERDEKYAAIARERLEAESRGLSLRDSRNGQTSIFDAIGGT
jgi:DNA modification methylase